MAVLLLTLLIKFNHTISQGTNMGLQTAQGYNLTPDTVGDVSRGLNVGLGYQQAQQKMRQNEQSMRLGNQKSDILAEQQLQDKRNQAMQNAAYAVSDSMGIPDDQKLAFWQNHKAKTLANNPNAITSDTDRMIATYQSGDIEGGNALTKGALDSFVRKGFYKPQQWQTPKQRENADRNRILEGAIDPETGKLKPVDQLTAIQKATAISAKLLAGEGTKGELQRTLESPDLTKKSIKFTGDKTAAKSDAKFKSQQTFKAGIAADVKLAEAAAKARGETLTELGRAEASLPGIKTVIDKLSILADGATFTLAGKGWDLIAKEFFGVSTEGSTAKAKMISMVDNQVLPMLRPIFGSQFTAIEGDRLRAAMLDPDSTPGSRKAQLSSFYSQMEANIKAKKIELANSDPTRIKDTTSFGGADGPAESQSTAGPQEGEVYKHPDGRVIKLVNGKWENQ